MVIMNNGYVTFTSKSGGKVTTNYYDLYYENPVSGSLSQDQHSIKTPVKNEFFLGPANHSFDCPRDCPLTPSTFKSTWRYRRRLHGVMKKVIKMLLEYTNCYPEGRTVYNVACSRKHMPDAVNCAVNLTSVNS